ncbi:MAG: RlmE family RNA methyltransferase [Betaproteobacteria bacterium]|jgi:23S rRNA (uridine2552-2'-O)-methyltransferase|nr:RlmE family RNA methyltransferase [Betaproteobacteria bacterium]MDH4293078.1 RlmE family RNA methyltransferase [Betaproteobacteria bacterium]MDH5343302.1 RlmE family RNA methyltransferase [Betaproteobacteria bacterium]
MARNKTSKAWMHEHVNDPYVKRAQAEGMRSRAAYKLEQLAERDKLLKPGMVVVDLGAAPGGWSQVAGRAVGPAGRVVAVDLLEMAPVAGVTFIHGDFSEDDVLADVEKAVGSGGVDLVLSDMAPNISGVAGVDQARSVGLAELALDFAVNHLKPQGNFLVKVFQGSGFDALVADIRRKFVQVMIRKPEASRSRSNEVYVVGKGRKAGK